MKFRPGDLAIVTAQTDDSNFEFPHVMKGDIVQVVRCVPRNVIPNKHPEAERVWCDCDIEAHDGTVWPALFSALAPFPGDAEGSSWRDVALTTGWKPAAASVAYVKPELRGPLHEAMQSLGSFFDEEERRKLREYRTSLRGR